MTLDAKHVHERLYQTLATVQANILVGPGTYRLTLSVPEIAANARPGQFLEILPGSGLSRDPLLRRPISICATDAAAGCVDLVYREVGRGTRLLGEKKAGDQVDVVGPVGNGFILPEDVRNILLVAGGIGMPPLHALAQYYPDRNFTLYYGARNHQEIIMEQDWDRLQVPVKIATDDGSKGFHGRVTDLLLKEAFTDYDICCACGPRPMLRSLADLLKQQAKPGLFSLEERMACGVGACLGCVCKTNSGYRRVCVDGPVFAVEEVIWDE